jgi:hypothetical protein
MDHLRPAIENKIQRLAADYRRVPGSILTEDDLQCLLVRRLLEIPELRHTRPTLDGMLGTMVHTEVSWFDENHQLRIKPDVTILDPQELSMFHALRHGYPLPRKGFNFAGSSIIFELKFVRNKLGISRACTRTVRDDIGKIIRLFERLAHQGAGHELFCYFVIFSKVAQRVPEFDELIAQGPQHPRCRIIFETAGVTWPPAG